MTQKKVTFAIGSLTGGGAERVVSVWANNLSELGYKVSIVVFGRDDDEYEISDKVQIHSAAATNDDFLRLSYWDRITRIRQIIKEINPDYIVPFLSAMQIYMLIVSCGLKAKRIETIRINPWIVKLSPFRRMLWKLCYGTAHKIILQTQEQAPFFSKSEQKRSIVVPNPINDIFITRYKQSVSKQVTNFIAVGRIDPQKNYEMMIDGFAKVANKHPHIILRIFGIGEEEYTKVLQNRIDTLKMSNNIFLMGRTNHIEQELINSDVFLMTSDFEGSPNALIEAMASQLLCVSTDCKTGPKDLISNGENGFLVPTGNVEKLCDVIYKIMNMGQAERLKIAKTARLQIFQKHSKENSINKLCSIFE